MSKKFNVKTRHRIECPFCKRTRDTFYAKEMKSGRYKVWAKCNCGFEIKNKFYVEYDKIEKASFKLFDLWMNIYRQKKIKDMANDFTVSRSQRIKAIYGKARADYVREKEKEYYDKF